jgi:hypothetical protein
MVLPRRFSCCGLQPVSNTAVANATTIIQAFIPSPPAARI